MTNHLCGGTMTVRAGQPIASKYLEPIKDDHIKTDFIRANLYALMSRIEKPPRLFTVPLSEVNKTKTTPSQLEEAFNLLDSIPEFKIRENNALSVFLFNQKKLLDLSLEHAKTYALLKDEIGRLREVTFRDIGEGSGQTRDLDQFDDFHSHLTLWDRNRKQLIGAYRIAFTHEILPQYGINGLYTSKQFEYADEFFEKIGPAIELSRAFIIKEYQKTHTSLSTLLGALGQLLIGPQPVHALFGAVSISNEFQSVSKKLILDFLNQYHGLEELEPFITPKNPPELPINIPEGEWKRLKKTTSDLSLLNTVVSSIEADGKNIPPLIPVYLSLSGRFVAFDYDAHFNCIDGLLVVNMRKAAKENNLMVKRLIGRESFEACQKL